MAYVPDGKSDVQHNDDGNEIGGWIVLAAIVMAVIAAGVYWWGGFS
jgi:hypothetical protein